MNKFSLYFFMVCFLCAPAFADDIRVSRAIPNTTNAYLTGDVSNNNRDADDSANTENISARSGAISRSPQASSNRGDATASVSRTGDRPDIENSNTVSRRAAGVRTNATGADTTVRRSALITRQSPVSVGRTSVVRTNKMDAIDATRAVQSRAAATTPGVQPRETIKEATDRLQQTSDLNKSCQTQYNDCMDQFCGVIDANQKRCSCSANLTRYTKVESAVKEANVQLNDVAQRIRYIGLSADEIRSIMSATEAELVLSGTRDNTESRNMLSEIEALIKNPTSATTSGTDSFSGLDMDLDFTADSQDLFNLDFLGNSSSSFSNLRGTELYNAAKKRCNTILTQCKDAGATSAQITGNYDLAIDKDCIAYEAGLTKMNETLKNNVRSAGRMLEKARLAVLQNKNQYDAKGCIAALNTCMTDDMVCGADYTKCLDPTKRYIDENGKVVLGQRISDITDFMKAYDNATINQSFLESAKGMTVSIATCKSDAKGSCVAKYLMSKIGTGGAVKDGGLCRAVLDKCQSVSYNQNNIYNPYNEVVVNYIQRAMVNINAAQQKIVSDYAGGCMVDIATCYNQQVSQVNAWSSSASISSIYNVMRGACRNVALTCSYAVFAADTDLCPTGAAPSDADKCINAVSEMFYQSLLCPENSSYKSDTSGDVNDRCKCDTGYNVFGKTCVRDCSPGEYRNSIGSCDKCQINKYSDVPNATSCTACPAGKTSPAGSTSLSACIATVSAPAP